MATHQHQHMSSLPSPPPQIVQSVISTTPTISHTPIVAPMPKPQISYAPQPSIMHHQHIQTSQMSQTQPAPQISYASATQQMQSRPEIKISQGYELIPAPNIITSVPPVTVKTMTTALPTITTSATPILTSSNVVYSEQQMTTIHTSAQNQNSYKLAQEQENEQFALAWLRATFEPVSALASRIEQQDLYKMYLTACSKIGRTGVVSQYHFPRCVRNVFGGTVGPNQIKIKQNAISNFFYEGIRIRAQPLAVVHKGTILVSISMLFAFALIINYHILKMCIFFLSFLNA